MGGVGRLLTVACKKAKVFVTERIPLILSTRRREYKGVNESLEHLQT